MNFVLKRTVRNGKTHIERLLMKKTTTTTKKNNTNETETCTKRKRKRKMMTKVQNRQAILKLERVGV